MTRKKEIGVLLVLMLLLLVVLYRDLRPGVMAGSDTMENVAVQPLRVPDPDLHLDRLAQIQKMDYTGNHRNIFSATPPPPPPSGAAMANRAAAAAAAAAAVAHAGPPVPPQLHVPLTFYGMAIDPKTGQKLAFFTSGDHVYIASQGETLLGHFRLLQIGRNSVEFQETGSGQMATLTMTPLLTK